MIETSFFRGGILRWSMFIFRGVSLESTSFYSFIFPQKIWMKNSKNDLKFHPPRSSIETTTPNGSNTSEGLNLPQKPAEELNGGFSGGRILGSEWGGNDPMHDIHGTISSPED